jgi:hypothetical protein
MERLLLRGAVVLPTHYACLGFFCQERRLLYCHSRLSERPEPLDDKPYCLVKAGTIFRRAMTCQFGYFQKPLQAGMRDKRFLFHAHSTVRRHDHQRQEIDLDRSARMNTDCRNRLSASSWLSPLSKSRISPSLITQLSSTMIRGWI